MIEFVLFTYIYDISQTCVIVSGVVSINVSKFLCTTLVKNVSNSYVMRSLIVIKNRSMGNCEKFFITTKVLKGHPI